MDKADRAFLDTFGCSFPGTANQLRIPRLRFELASGPRQERLDTALKRCDALFAGAFRSCETAWVQLMFFGECESRTQVDTLVAHGLIPSSDGGWVHSRPPGSPPEDDVNEDLYSGVVSTASPGFAALFRAIVLGDHGGWLALSPLALVFSPEVAIGFWPYDDRGADLFSPRADILLPYYHEFTDWILEDDRPRILRELGLDESI